MERGGSRHGDGFAWFLVSNGEKTLRKRQSGSWVGVVSIPAGVAGGHGGAPGIYDGWVYVPVQGPHGVFKIRTDLTDSQWFPISNNGKDILPWCAVNPCNGRLYTSLYLDRVQGSVFTSNGRVILVRCDYNAIFCFSTLTGHCFGAKAISGMDEAESVAVHIP